ncbi:MAG: hypothetical protein ABFC96_16065 [Thermoguttaceae bacterium]
MFPFLRNRRNPAHGSAATVNRPLLRLHRSTWLAVSLLAVVFILIAVPAHPTGNNFSLPSTGWCLGEELEHGWPWPYMKQMVAWSDAFATASPDLSPPWWHWENWSYDGDLQRFTPGNLVCDLAVVFGVLVSLAVILEWRRRRLSHAWQFTLRELLLATFLLSCLLSWCMVRRDQFRREHAESEKQPDVDFAYTGPLWLRNLIGSSPMGMFEGGELGIIHLGGWSDAGDNDLAESLLTLRKYPRLGSLIIGGFVGDHGFDQLAELPSLHVLFIAIDKRGVTHIGRLASVECLSLEGDGVDRALVEQLGALPRLRSLSIGLSPFRDDDCAALSGLKALEELRLNDTGDVDLSEPRFFGKGLGAALEKLNGLTTLGLYRTRLSEHCLAHIEKLTSLTALDLSSSSITDAEMDRIAKLAGLRMLVLRETKITNNGVRSLGPLKGLRVLDLSGTKIDDACAADLAALSRLRLLDVSGTRMTLNGLLQLRGLKNLQHLGIAPNALTAKDLKRLQDAMPGCTIGQTLGGMGAGFF